MLLKIFFVISRARAFVTLYLFTKCSYIAFELTKFFNCSQSVKCTQIIRSVKAITINLRSLLYLSRVNLYKIILLTKFISFFLAIVASTCFIRLSISSNFRVVLTLRFSLSFKSNLDALSS